MCSPCNVTSCLSIPFPFWSMLWRAASDSLNASILAKTAMVVLLPTHWTHSLWLFFFFFFWMNQVLKERRFADIAEVQWESLVAFDNFSIEDFKQCFQQWEQRWDHCIQSEGSTSMGIKFQTCMNILNKIF